MAANKCNFAKTMGTPQMQFSVLALLFALVGGQRDLPAASVEGALRVWYLVTLTFTGKQASETEATFRDHRLDVTFSKGDKSFRVPGYFAAEGNAAESSATSGNKWRVKLTPNEPGAWTYSVAFREGPEIAVPAVSSPKEGKSAGVPDGEAGSFTVRPADPGAAGFYGQGMLAYVGEHYLQFQGSKKWLVKAGPGSPEDFFGCQDFDGTTDDPNKKSDTEKKDTYLYEDHGFGAGKGVGLHRYLFHLKHWKEGDPTWQGGKGKGITGAINYLSEIGANTLYHIILTRDDDADNTWPWTDRETQLVYDVSKLDQWDIVYTHMDRKGIHADLYLCEADNSRHLNVGMMGTERSIFCREIVARFGHHLGLRYNVGEEHGLNTAQIKAIAAHISTLDVYGHPVVSHSFHQLEKQHQQFKPLLGFKEFHGACYQLHTEHHTEVIQWWDPRKSDGGGLQDGSITKIIGGDIRSLGNPPSDADSSWAALVLATDHPEQACEAKAGFSIAGTNAPEGAITFLYTADFASVFPNPERGWHNRCDVDGRGGNDVRNFSDVKAAGHRLVHSYLRLIDATFPASAKAGSSFVIAANLCNDGYASVIKPRPIYLVFDNGTDRCNFPLHDVDVRKWVSGAVTLPKQTVALPAHMPPGTYKLALWLPDYHTDLQSRPEYSIRLANQGIWDATKGYNVLHDSLAIMR